MNASIPPSPRSACPRVVTRQKHKRRAAPVLVVGIGAERQKNNPSEVVGNNRGKQRLSPYPSHSLPTRMLAFQPDRAAPVLALTNNLLETFPGNAAASTLRLSSLAN